MDPSQDHEKEKIERLRRAMYSRTISEQLKDRPQPRLEPSRPIVGEDWRRPEEGVAASVVAPRTIGLARTALRWVLGLSIVFFLGAMAFFGYYFTFGGGALPASPGNIDIVVSGPPQIAGGEPTQLQITVTNRNRVALQLADLVISYPTGTRSPADLSTDLSSQRISLGTIEPGDRRQGTVSAVFSGSGNEPANVKVELEYRLEGSSAIFVAHSEYQAAFSAAALSVSVEGNSETVSGQPVEFTVSIASNASAPVKDVLLSASFPFGFTFTNASPKATEGSVWELGDFAPGEKKEILVRGTLKGEEADERVFRFTAGTRKSPSDKGITVPLSESTFGMRIANPFLGLSVAVGGKSGNGVVVAPGDIVNVTINWQNNLLTAVTDAVLVARLSGIQIDGATVTSANGFYRSSDSAMLWDKSTTRGELANIPSGGRGSVTFSFRMPDGATLESIRNPTLTISVNAAGKRVSEDGVPENLQSAATQRIGLTSSLNIAAQGLYYANPFGSTGPLPPKAESETTYAIVFTITNTTNKIENARLTATLPPYVRWTGIYSPGSEKLTFNQSNGTVTWDIGAIDPGVGLGGTSPRQAAIAIGFTPSTSQIGQEPQLLQNIVFTGDDAAAGSAITRNINPVTTNIVGDPGFNSTQATVGR
ncbi:hypothetical protein C4585_01740 [Candidatus Parcubacteria bacterium]|nr:MAG: hypothetical protein C4585_01740 [Candidatus Parcubacteria bacterium]